MIRFSWYRVSRMANDDARLILREKDTVFEGLQNVGLSPFDFEWQVEKNYREPLQFESQWRLVAGAFNRRQQ